ncbi:cyclohexanecarboxylate-CoA ligase [Actinoplanes regularis]|nr:cyclohexanecarboxylate-CoA ligase [Actinoplanes regularis]
MTAMKTFEDVQVWLPGAIRPADAVIDGYRRLGLWHDEHLLTHLERHRRQRPDATALLGFHAEGPADVVSWSRYAAEVERYASALRALGVGPGQVVAVQMPNRWETAALMLAVMHTGAILAPLVTALRGRELEKMLVQLRATVVVTVGEWAGFDHASSLAGMADRLPHLRHRVVLGSKSADEFDFDAHFRNTDWTADFPAPLADSAADPDNVAVVLFTSGTTGEPKAVLHTANTLLAGAAPVVNEDKLGAGDVSYNPHNLTHIFGITTGLAFPLLSGGSAVLLDTWSPVRAAQIIRDTRVTVFSGAAIFLEAVFRVADDLSSLRMVCCGAAPVPPKLVREIHAKLGVPLRAGWGMTEVPLGTFTRSDDPADHATISDGRPAASLELDLRVEGTISRENPARLFVRGAALCIALVGRDTGTVHVLAEHDGGWFDTGDLVLPDGHGGIRLAGRAADRIGGILMVPVLDVEAELMRHPAVADVAIVGYEDEHGHDAPCAVVVPAGEPPTLAGLRAYLDGVGMTEFYQPTRLELMPVLPRNLSGKVLKRELRERLRG